MSKKTNNRLLIIILLALIGLFVFVKFFRSSWTERTMKTDIVEIDTAKISSIVIYPNSQKGTEVKFYKENNNWKVSDTKIVADADVDAVKGLINTFTEMKVLRLVTKSKDKWEEYQVTDSAATRVKVLVGKKVKADFYIGKFTYKQSHDPYSMYGGGGGGITGTTYVRVSDENDVYTVNGFLTFTFNQGFDSWRNRKLGKFVPAEITKFTIKNPGDSSSMVQIKNNQYTVNNQPADSAKIANFLNKISYKSGSKFDDQFNPAMKVPFFELTLEKSLGTALSIKAYAKDSLFIVNSSVNAQSYFEMQASELSDLFVGPNAFIKQ